MIVIIVIILFSFILSENNQIDSYFSLDNRLEYKLIEYGILKTGNNDVFILNQPYSNAQTFKILKKVDLIDTNFYNRYGYLNKEDGKVGVKSSLGLNRVEYDEENLLKPFVSLDGYMNLNDIILVNSIDIDKTLKDDLNYHGDKEEWATAYITDSYLLYKKNNIEIFGGRTLRNFGALNEYGLLLSNNPYSFDHYGFSSNNEKIKYSFYCTRLNNVKKGLDSQGMVIPFEYDNNGNLIVDDNNDPILTEVETKRYFSVQRLDFKVSNNFQGALSAATIYGGPNQGFVADFINPINLYYLSQRNNQTQMNNFYQLSLFYKINNSSIYFDFLIDDIIVNNEPGATDEYDNRLGLVIKFSSSDVIFDKSLFSIRYAKIWNETYLSYRNFENYTFFNKGIGFPFNGFEGLKFSFSLFKYKKLLNNVELELYRKGDNDLSDLFFDEPSPFPSGEVEYGLSLLIDLLYFSSNDIDLSYSYSYNRSSDSFKNLSEDFNSNSFYKFKLVYNFQY